MWLDYCFAVCGRGRLPVLIATMLLGVGLPAAGAAAGGASQLLHQTPSVLEIPFRFSLQGLFQETERIVPTQVGHWSEWKQWHGIDTQYRAWRGPLAVQLTGDTLTLQAHVHYWVRVRKKLLESLEIKAGCGVDEAPRQALIGIQMRLVWNPDWTPRPLFRLLPTRFLDSCEMTAAEIDVTPLVGVVFQEQMRESLRRALATLSPVMGSVRHRAEATWRRLNEPLSIADRGWLRLNPVAVALSPVFGSGNRATVHLAVALRPRLIIGDQPASRPTALPPLRPFFPSSAGIRFQLGMEVDYGRIGQLISKVLAGKTFQVKDHRFGIDSVALSGKGQELNAKLRLNGQARGSAEIWAEVGFDPESKTLKLKGLDYLFEPVDSDLYLLAGMFYEKISQLLLETANGVLEREMNTLGSRLETALAGVAPSGSRLDLGQIRLASLRIEFLPDGVRLEGAAEGSVQVSL